MRSALLLAGALTLGAISAASAQESFARGQQQWQPLGFFQAEPQNQHPRELNYKDWKNSDEAREFSRSEYSGKITNK
ncbi:MAG TPA: hypothetical protein VKT73_12235 [Xanthobacteraceae bacterium]|nr:hypothetical protein [Xanthobacteraceae bacterium]